MTEKSFIILDPGFQLSANFILQRFLAVKNFEKLNLNFNIKSEHLLAGSSVSKKNPSVIFKFFSKLKQKLV
jgi:hypothetical protein